MLYVRFLSSLYSRLPERCIGIAMLGLLTTYSQSSMACDRLIQISDKTELCFDYSKMTAVWASHSFILSDVLGNDGQPYYSDDRVTGEDNRRYNRLYGIEGHQVARNYERYAFARDRNIPPFYKALPVDYAQSDYIRGLLIGRDFVPNKPDAQKAIVSMVNTIPMTDRFKRDKWDNMDVAALNILDDAPDSRVHMVSGALYDADTTRFENGRIVDSVERKVAVPDAYFRAFYVEDTKRMYALMVPRKDSGRPLENYALPVDEIERLSGYNFFSWVDDTTEMTQERSTGYIKPFLPRKRSGEQVDLGKALLSIFD